jgi:phenylacetate-coenzyme A ligase PaaK-like adenylate-forming protein
MIGVVDVTRIAWAVTRHRWAPRDRIVAFRDLHLRRLIRHAYDHVPFYRVLLDRHGIRPDAIRTAADLARIPVTSKRDLQQAHAEELIARRLDAGRLLSHRTSGSSGEPRTMRRTWLEERLGTVFRLRAFRDFGLRPGDRRAGVGLVRAHDPRDWDGPQRIVRALGLYRKAVLRLPNGGPTWSVGSATFAPMSSAGSPGSSP